MIIIMILSAITGTSLYFHSIKKVKGPWEIFSFLFGAFGGIFLLMFLFLSTLHYISVVGEVQRFISVRETVEYARKTDSIENAALQHKIIEANEWLRTKQYWNATLFDIAIPDEVDNLEPIR